MFGRVATVLYVQRTNLSVMMQLECFSILQRRLRNGVRRLTSLIAIPLRGALDILAPQATYSFTGLGCGLVLITHISQTMELHSCLPVKYQQHSSSELRIHCINIQFVLWCSNDHTLKQKLLFGIVLMPSRLTPLKRIPSNRMQDS